MSKQTSNKQTRGSNKQSGGLAIRNSTAELRKVSVTKKFLTAARYGKVRYLALPYREPATIARTA